MMGSATSEGLKPQCAHNARQYTVARCVGRLGSLGYAALFTWLRKECETMGITPEELAYEWYEYKEVLEDARLTLNANLIAQERPMLYQLVRLIEDNPGCLVSLAESGLLDDEDMHRLGSYYDALEGDWKLDKASGPEVNDGQETT